MSATQRSPAQAEAASRNGSRSKGPTSAAGKATSSTNAVSHGLNSKMLLLPGEDVAEYEDFTGHWFSSLGPTTFAEAQIVALIADAAWRLERLRRIEFGKQLAGLQRNLEQKREFMQLHLAKRAHVATTALFDILTEMDNPPEALADIAGIVMAMSTVLGMVKEVDDLPVGAVDRLEAVIEALSADRQAQVGVSALVQVAQAAEEVKLALETRISAMTAVVSLLKEKIAAETVLLTDAELRRTAKYQQLLESTLSRHLHHLKSVRDSIKTVGTDDNDRLREFQVRLRVVR
jgi:hypothetical protein